MIKSKRIAVGIALSACIAVPGIAVRADGGYSVTQKEAERIKLGMSADEVRSLIGRPFSDVQYRNEAGPVWLYNVTDAIDPVFFEISFGTDRKVTNLSQYVDPRAYTGR